jgi:hypothetical protein
MVAIAEDLRLGRLAVHLAVGVQTDVAVRVDEPGQHPAIDARPVARGWRGQTDPAIDDPDLVANLIRSDQDRARQVQRFHTQPP